MKGKRLASLLLALLLVLACCPVLSAQAADNGDYTREDIAWYMDGIVSWCAKRLGVSEDAILSTLAMASSLPRMTFPTSRRISPMI